MDFEFKTENVSFHPRFETEILVEKALEAQSLKKNAPNILDIGTGCGNIAISLTKYIPSSRIVALDISDTALRVAAENAAKYGVDDRIEFIRSDLFGNIRTRYRNFFDLIISNPPYVSLEDFSSLPAEVKDDPYIALYGGRDGLGIYRRIIKEARIYLKREGVLLVEVGYGQSRSVKDMLSRSGVFSDEEIYKDYSGIERIVSARKNG